MSFDLFYNPCRYSTEKRQGIDPFTRKPKEFYARSELAAVEVQAVMRVFSAAKARVNDGYFVDFPDGGSGEIYGEYFADGMMLAVRGMTPQLIQFAFDLLSAANWALTAPSEDVVSIITPSAKPENLPGKFPRLVICSSPAELGMLLRGGFGEWKKFRDQIVGE